MKRTKYEYGPVNVDKVLVQPTQEKFNEWKEAFLNIEGVYNYNIWLCGGFREGNPTWDIDIILSEGPINEQLSKIMVEGTIIGFEQFSITVDIQYIYRPQWPLANYTLTNDKKELEPFQIEKYTIADKCYINKELVQEWKNAEKILPNLFKVKAIIPTDKHLDYIKQGRKYTHPILI